MSLENDMLNLRREIDSLHAARAAMMHRLARFHAHLKKSTERSMAEFRKALAKDCSRARAARENFNSRNQQAIGELIGAFNSDRGAGHRHFMGKHA